MVSAQKGQDFVCSGSLTLMGTPVLVITDLGFRTEILHYQRRKEWADKQILWDFGPAKIYEYPALLKHTVV
jgi:hypothetical protein